MVSSGQMIEKLDKFIEENMREPKLCNTVQFRNGLKALNNNFLKLHSSCLNNVNYKMLKMLKLILNIIKYIEISDSMDPLHRTVYIDYMQLSCLVTRLKFVILKEYPQGVEIIGISLKNYSIEQNIARNYQSKFNAYILTINYDKEISDIVQAFSMFLINYILYLEIIKENELLKQNFKLLLEVGDSKLLFENLDEYVIIIPPELQLDFMQKLAYNLNEVGYDFNICKFFMTPDKDTRSEACSLTYYTLKHMLKSFPHENWRQTSNIFDHFPIKSILSVLESESTIDNLCGEAVELFIFPKYYKPLDIMPLETFDQKINKYIDVLKSLASTSGDHEFHNYRCPFALILLSVLYDFVVNSDLPFSSFVPLIQLIIDYLKTCKLPPNLKAATIVFEVYQRAKCRDEFLVLVKPLCRAISKSFEPHTVPDLLEVLDVDNRMSDRLIITANFLYDRSGNSMIKNADLQPFLYTLNEKVIYLTHQWFANKLWILPYSISLHISLLTGDEDRVNNNLAVLGSYLFIILDSNQVIDLDDKNYFLIKLIMHYTKITGLIPNDFLLICWKNVLTPKNLGIKAAKMIISLCPTKKFKVILRLLKHETMRVIDLQDGSTDNNYYLILIKLWYCLLNKPCSHNHVKRSVLRTSAYNFVFALRSKYKFKKKNLPTVELIFLMKLLSLMLKILWMNSDDVINCSLQVITYVEHGSHITENVLTETTKLLINVYKCPVNAIKMYLGIFMISFSKMLKKCWAFAMEKERLGILHDDDNNLLKPFYKLEKCSSLFKDNAQYFENASQYLDCHLMHFMLNFNLPQKFKECYYNIIYNLMDLCSDAKIKEMLVCVDELEHHVWFTAVYNNYKNNRFIGV
ncbi:uncharacterized protein LOC126842970 isoform X1 [Adelges cooleyi]|uniref:uncharacterized protein LOC126842970 isoform X1 n=1 Tax=Adelges cooleyi TaxID=133065 RepID=UPI002180154D|nr:uncharacterized protein LOC126842970 isoform X1 [Adelges cooleyi]